MNNPLPLCDLQAGQKGQVHSLCHPTLGQRLADIGLVKGRWVTCIGHAPLGDPTAYEICGAVVAIRQADAAHVLVCTEGCEPHGNG